MQNTSRRYMREMCCLLAALLGWLDTCRRDTI
jgi:hypothetical protein